MSLALAGENFFHRDWVLSSVPSESRALKPTAMMFQLFVAAVSTWLVTTEPVKFMIMSGCGESEQPVPLLACPAAASRCRIRPIADHEAFIVALIAGVRYMFTQVSEQDHEWYSFICTYADSMCLPFNDTEPLVVGNSKNDRNTAPSQGPSGLNPTRATE